MTTDYLSKTLLFSQTTGENNNKIKKKNEIL